MKQKSIFLAVVSSLAIAVGSAWGAGAILPYGESFDTGTDGHDLTAPWSPGGEGIYDAQSTVDGSSQVGYFSDDGTFTVDSGTYDYDNVWWFCYAKVTPGSSDPDLSADTETVAAFYIDDNNALRAFDGDPGVGEGEWKDVATGLTGVDGWIGLAVHLDFDSDKWDIYKTANGYTYGDELVLLTTTPLNFNENASTVSELHSAIIEGTTSVDKFAMNRGTSNIVDGVTSPVKAVNASEQVYIDEELTGILCKYFSTDDSYLDGPLGAAVSGGLLSGDKVHVYSTDGSWTAYEVNGQGGWNGTQPTGVQIKPTTSVWVEYAEANDGLTREPAALTAYDTPQSGGTATINGSNANYWTPLCLPFTASEKTLTGSGDPLVFANKEIGDLIRISNGATLWWNGSAWMKGGSPATGITLQPGEAFWYRRSLADPTDWNTDAL